MSTIYKVRVIPNAKHNLIEQTAADELKVRITAPPVEGKANKAVIDALCDYFNKRKSQVHILYGQTNRNKIIKID